MIECELEVTDPTFQPTWLIADPICTIVFSIIVLCTTLTILRDALHVLMEGRVNGILTTAVLYYDTSNLLEIDYLRLSSKFHKSMSTTHGR